MSLLKCSNTSQAICVAKGEAVSFRFAAPFVPLPGSSETACSVHSMPCPFCGIVPCHCSSRLVVSWRAYTCLPGSPVKRLMPGPSAGLLDEEDREAKYCESPFFTLWLPDGQGIHVGVHDGLYRDLVLCMEKLRAGMRACDAQLAKIEAYNGTRSTDGAYVFGMETAETGRGGVFLVDCSAAMPPNALSFVARQLAFLLEHWYANSGGGRIPLYNVVAATGNNIAKLCDHLKPVNGKMMNNVPPWLTSQTDTTQVSRDGSARPRAPRAGRSGHEEVRHAARSIRVLWLLQVGFNMVLALKMALRLADGKVPVHVITGGMSNGFHGFRGE